jgi:hypothetical protein
VRICQAFALKAGGGSDTAPPRSELLMDGKATGISLPGVVLDAQFRCGDSFVLFTTENIPYEEALHITLLDGGLRALDHVELSHQFAAGALTDVQMGGDTQVRFSFFGGDLWELTVLGAPRRLARGESPVGVKGHLGRMVTPRFLALVRLR